MHNERNSFNMMQARVFKQMSEERHVNKYRNGRSYIVSCKFIANIMCFLQCNDHR
jgi:hypothetical protein